MDSTAGVRTKRMGIERNDKTQGATMNRRRFFTTFAKTIATVAVAQQLVKGWAFEKLGASPTLTLPLDPSKYPDRMIPILYKRVRTKDGCISEQVLCVTEKNTPRINPEWENAQYKDCFPGWHRDAYRSINVGPPPSNA